MAPLGEEFQHTENNSAVEENLSAELREKQRITDALVHKKTKHPEIAPQENRKKFSDNEISKDEPEESAALGYRDASKGSAKNRVKGQSKRKLKEAILTQTRTAIMMIPH